jgi:hypothetical protein
VEGPCASLRLERRDYEGARTELERAVEAIAERVGEWFRHSWDSAWVLHVWGFHEGKLDSRAVKLRAPSVERMALEAEKLLKSERSPH